MIQCKGGCNPICEFCKWVIHEDGPTYIIEPKGCKLHPEEKVTAAHSCDDFYCFRADREESQEKQLS